MERTVLCHLPRAHYNDAIVVSDGLEAVSDGEDGAVMELRADCGLDFFVCQRIDRCCGLVEGSDVYGRGEKPHP